MLWRKYSKIQTTSQTLDKAHHLLTSMNIPNEETHRTKKHSRDNNITTH
jgi:hypothetical protein